MKKNLVLRFNYFLGFVTIVFLLLMAKYLEIYQGEIPCALCLLQRYTLIALGGIFVIGMLFNMQRIGRLLIALLSLLTAGIGILFSGRQAWLQHMPLDNVGECGASLAYMFKVLPFFQVIKNVWQGGMECSQTGWLFLNLSLAEWSLICFCGFLLLILIQLKNIIKS